MTAHPLLPPDLVRAYEESGYWGRRSLTDLIRQNVEQSAARPAIVSERHVLTWGDYDRAADLVAATLIAHEVEPGQRIGILLPDGGMVHAAMVGTERAGATAVGLGPRAAYREIEYLLGSTGACALVTHDSHRGRPTADLVSRLRAGGMEIKHVVLPVSAEGDVQPLTDGEPLSTVRTRRALGEIDARRLGPNDLFLINSTSGTTGLPKRVTQFQNRWFFYDQLVRQSIDLQPEDVFLSVVPAPFGFGLWTAHFTPALNGGPVVVMEHFTPEGALELIERERVTIACCVSTQLIMLTTSPRLASQDLSSLRAVYTGGEAVPYHRAAEFEERTGAKVLQFYGSNETGAYSSTSSEDSRDDRLTTCGRAIEVMRPRVFVDEVDVTATGGPGQPGCRGPATCAGYFEDPEANSRLYTSEGWMLMEDIVEIDERGYVRVTGRIGDFIIRGGKNISAAAVEDAVGTHPRVELVAVVPVPDDVFGERVGAFVVLREGTGLGLEELGAHLDGQGFSKETFPEHLFIVDDLPRSSGGKVAKGLLRDEVGGRIRD
jgi:acyl-CoA synthetase